MLSEQGFAETCLWALHLGTWLAWHFIIHRHVSPEPPFASSRPSWKAPLWPSVPSLSPWSPAVRAAQSRGPCPHTLSRHVLASPSERVSPGSVHLRGWGAQCVMDKASQSQGQGRPGSELSRARALLSSWALLAPAGAQSLSRGPSPLPCWGAGSKQSPLPCPWPLCPALRKAARCRGCPQREALLWPPPRPPPPGPQAPASTLTSSSLCVLSPRLCSGLRKGHCRVSPGAHRAHRAGER